MKFINTPHCIWMIGLSGSGKSTIAKEYANKYNASIVSSNGVRKELYGKENIQGDPNAVFGLVYNRCCNLLKNGFSVILDCTNIKRKDRKKFFDYCNKKNINAIHHAIVLCTPYHICLKRNNNRHRVVPEDVIKRQMYNFNIPFFQEGFDYITLYGWGDAFKDISIDSKNSYNIWNEENYNSMLEIMKGYDQKNKHHKLDLYEHSNKVSNILYNLTNSDVLKFAGLVHDIGKISTQIIDDSGQAHYYNHAEVGTYKLLSNLDIFNLSDSDVLQCLFYVNYHMLVFSLTTEKAKNKYKNIFGEFNYQNLCLFNYADKESCK